MEAKTDNKSRFVFDSHQYPLGNLFIYACIY